MLEAPREGVRSLRPAMAAGALAILVFVAVSALVNPIVVDETLGSGAVLANLPPYPPGHPHVHFYERAFSLGNHVTAAALELGIERDSISLARNGLALFLALFEERDFARLPEEARRRLAVRGTVLTGSRHVHVVARAP